MSSVRSEHQSAVRSSNVKKKVKEKKVGLSLSGDVVSQRYAPEAVRHANGWQVNFDDMKSRISSLFNCYTLSDIVFDVEVHQFPAHKFILASASPVFYKQLYEAPLDFQAMIFGSGLAAGGPSEQRQMTLAIDDVPHLAFFEFLQFIYTDNVSVTLENASQLLFLADIYKVAGLSSKCMDFLRSEIVPTSVLRVLAIVRTLMLKAVVGSWRDVTAASKEQKRMKTAHRRSQSEEQDGNESQLGGDGAKSSRCSSPRGSAANSRRGSVCSRRSVGGGGQSQYGGGGSQHTGEDYDDGASGTEFGGVRKLPPLTDSRSFTGSMTDTKISIFCDEISMKCWKCIRDQTDAVLLCPDFFDQELNVLKQIFKLENCSVDEITFFRAANAWAERRCAKLGEDNPSAERKRQTLKNDLLGEDTLEFIRFPVMTVEQFQWEVVPTGLLEYEDVQSVLNAIANRGGSVHQRYNTEMRSNTRLLLDSMLGSLGDDKDADDAALAAAGQKPGLYEPVPDDALDCMLAGELLRYHLKQTTADHSQRALWDDLRSTAAEGADAASSATPSRLPAIAGSGQASAPTGGLPPFTPRPPGTARGFGSSPRKGRKTADMVMGRRLDASTLQQPPGASPAADDGQKTGSVGSGGGRRAQASDFKRIAAGLYRFRVGSLVEVWLEAAEPMMLNHGPWSENGFEAAEDAAEDYVRQRSGEANPTCSTPRRRNPYAPCPTSSVRLALGLSSVPPIGHGMPLASFLCRV